MAKIDWPEADKRSLIGKRISRVDGPVKSTGRAKYSYDINRPKMLWAKLITAPHAKAEVKNIDTSAAEALPGVQRDLEGGGNHQHTILRADRGRRGRRNRGDRQ